MDVRGDIFVPGTDMKRKDTLGFWIKTLDNLFFRNMIAYETCQEGMDEVTVMHGWILGRNLEEDIVRYKDTRGRFRKNAQQ